MSMPGLLPWGGGAATGILGIWPGNHFWSGGLSGGRMAVEQVVCVWWEWDWKIENQVCLEEAA